MKLTAKQIQGVIYDRLRNSNLSAMLSGNVYREGYRPRDSQLEDAIVIFTAGQTGAIQEGVITVNIFVPDLTSADNGTYIENGQRCSEIESAAAEWIEGLFVPDYKFELQSAIQTDSEDDIHQHFIAVRIKYYYL